MTAKKAYYSMPKICLLPNLGFGSHEEMIRVRIIRIWDAVSYRAPDELVTYLILLDEEDKLALALTQSPRRTPSLNQLHEGMVYYISNFKVVVGPPKWNPVSAERALLFGQQTTVRACYDGCYIARYKFELCPLPTISAHLGQISNLIGRLYLQTTTAAKLYFDLSYKKLGLLGDLVASTYGEFLCRLPTTAIYENLYPISVQKIYLNLQEMRDPDKWLQPKLFRKQSFFCKVTIVDILLHEKWDFRPLCMNESPSQKVYHCGSCNMSFILINRRSKTVILAADSTTNTKLILSAYDLEQITGLTMLQLMTDCSDSHMVKGGAALQDGISRIKETLCTFQVEAPVSWSLTLLRQKNWLQRGGHSLTLAAEKKQRPALHR